MTGKSDADTAATTVLPIPGHWKTVSTRIDPPTNSGRRNAKITITNKKGRLSKEEIENLIKEAERYKDQDEKLRKKVEAKNGLESYCVSVKHSLEDEKLKDKFDASDKEAVTKKVK